jgi:hypothetical protein
MLGKETAAAVMLMPRTVCCNRTTAIGVRNAFYIEESLLGPAM